MLILMIIVKAAHIIKDICCFKTEDIRTNFREVVKSTKIVCGFFLYSLLSQNKKLFTPLQTIKFLES